MSRIELPYSVSIVVPSTMGLNEPIDNEQYVQEVAYSLAKMFGGYDILKGFGGYVSDNGEYI